MILLTVGLIPKLLPRIIEVSFWPLCLRPLRAVCSLWFKGVEVVTMVIPISGTLHSMLSTRRSLV